MIDDDQPFPSRWTFYIGIDGRVLYIDKQVSPTSHGKNVAAKLAELGIPRRRASQFEDGSARLLLKEPTLAALESEKHLLDREATAVANK